MFGQPLWGGDDSPERKAAREEAFAKLAANKGVAPDPMDRTTPGETPQMELEFKPKGFKYNCADGCGNNNSQYRCRLGRYVIYLCGDCAFIKFLDLMVVQGVGID